MSRSSRQKDCSWVSRKKKKARKSDQKPKKEFRKEGCCSLSSNSKGSWFRQESAFVKPASADIPVSAITRKIERSKSSAKVADNSCLPVKKKMMANCFQAASSRIGRSIFYTKKKKP